MAPRSKPSRSGLGWSPPCLALTARLVTAVPRAHRSRMTASSVFDRRRCAPSRVASARQSYRKALLAVHPDRQDPGDVEAKVLAQHVFDALRDAWNLFEKTG